MRNLVAFACSLALCSTLVGCTAGAASPFVSEEPIVSLALSPNGRDLAYVTRKREAAVLRIRSADAAPREVATGPVIRDIRFAGADRLVYGLKEGIGFYDIERRRNAILSAAASPLSVQGDRMLYMQGSKIRVRNLSSGEDRTVTDGSRPLEPFDWIDENTFLGCGDGHLWKVGLDGRRQRLLKGDRYAPRYVAARLSPDRRQVLLVSDDTCADVGAGGRSVWVLRLGEPKARQLFAVRPNAQWLDNESIVMFSRSKVVTMDVTTGSVSEIRDFGSVIEAFDCRDGQIVAAVRQTDEDGLFMGTAIDVVRVKK